MNAASGNLAPTRAITTLLVANRGEIARRVFRTARDMGMQTVAVFVEADADAPFVSDADLAVRLPDSYLDGAAIIDAAERTGADAIHPGYGFLSENADFAKAVVDAGLIWVGPTPAVIAAMGDKLEAKKLAIAADVPTLPSSEDPTAGAEVGFPLLVKASAGGGGKGMRVVERAADLDELVAAAKREALSGFGNDTVFLERYVPKARHVEIQIMGDQHGNVVHHGERECSIQRRHQKIIEEAPSPGISDETRRAMAAAAVGLGASLGYESAGTVEFLVDDTTGDFFFLEVNTRLQVEHPVTEMSFGGLDLVREQLLVAMGLPIDPQAVDHVGRLHAIEVRLYAEDPSNDFLPAIGTISALRHANNDRVRWDTGIAEGSEVTVSFDPMLAKVISWSDDRAEAALHLARELEQLHLGGVTTNREFLVNVLRSPEFLAGDTTTDFIERVNPARVTVLSEAERRQAATIGALWLRGRNRTTDDVWGSLPAGWRNARLPWSDATFAIAGEAVGVGYRSRRDGSLDLRDGGIALVYGWSPDSIDLEIDGIRSQSIVTATDRHLHIQMARGTASLELVPRFTVPGSDGPSGGFVAQMPGVVLDVRVAAGDAVTKGQTLVILEAMKMEHHMNAMEDGVVADVFVVAGQQVDNGAVLLAMEDEDSGEGVEA